MYSDKRYFSVEYEIDIEGEILYRNGTALFNVFDDDMRDSLAGLDDDFAPDETWDWYDIDDNELRRLVDVDDIIDDVSVYKSMNVKDVADHLISIGVSPYYQDTFTAFAVFDSQKKVRDMLSNTDLEDILDI